MGACSCGSNGLAKNASAAPVENGAAVTPSFGTAVGLHCFPSISEPVTGYRFRALLEPARNVSNSGAFLR